MNYHPKEVTFPSPAAAVKRYDRVKDYRTVVANLGSPDVLGLHPPKILASMVSGEGFWEF